NSHTVTLNTNSASGLFADPNIGTAKPVSVSGLSLNGADAPNYTLTQPSGLTANITAKALTITANSTNKTYGAAVTFTGSEFTTSGLVNPDTVTSVTLTSSGAAASASVGSYPIVPSAATGTGLTNYAITYQNGTLLVVAGT